MTNIYEFVQDISGITDTTYLSLVSAALLFFMVLATLNFALSIFANVFSRRI